MGMIPTLIIFESTLPRMLNSRVEMGSIVDIAWLQHQIKRVLEESVLLVVRGMHVAILIPSLSLRVVMGIPLLPEERGVSLIHVLNMLHLSQVMPGIVPMVTTRWVFADWGITGLLIA